MKTDRWSVFFYAIHSRKTATGKKIFAGEKYFSNFVNHLVKLYG